MAVEIQIWDCCIIKIRDKSLELKQKMSKWQMSGPYLKFINKIRQLKSAYYKGQQQKQMQSKQQLLSNEELFKMSVEVLRENLQMDEIQFQQFESDQKFKAYIRSIESIGLMLSKFYQEQENDLKTEIQSLKHQNRDFEQKLTNYMELNQSLKEQLESFDLKQAQYDQQLNKSQHEIEHGKHYIMTQINAKELLAQENLKLNTRNHQLLDQISNLKQIIETFNTQNYEGIKKIEHLHLQLSKFRTLNEKFQQQRNDLQAQKKALQAQINGLNQLLEQKDYLLGNKPIFQGQSYQNFAQIRERFLSSTVRVVREENEEVGSDKQVMKDIEQGCCVQPILALKFSDSRRISKKSQISSTSIRIQNIMLDDLLDNYQESPEHYGDRKLLKTDRKRKQSTGPKQPLNKSCNKFEQKNQKNSVSKVLFVNTSPKVTQKTAKGQLITDKKKKQQEPNPKFEINLQRNSSEQNYSKIKNRKLRSNASVVLRNTKGKVYGKQSNVKKGKIEHSQSVQDLYRDDISQTIQIREIERELYNKEKLIENLQLENRSVRQMVLEQSQKRTDAEHEYEQKIDKLQSEVQYFKEQMRDNYIKYVQEKALSDSLQNEILAISQQVQKKAQQYEKAKDELKEKCKHFIEESIGFYQSRYEQIQQKMRNTEFSYLNSKKDLNEMQDEQQKQHNPKQLKKCKSNSLFYKEVKHHSYNTSQEYSDINHLSANHSKNTSFINIDDEEGIERKPRNNQNILIYDCGEDYELEEGDQNLEELCSYREERQLCEMGVQTEVAWSEEDSSYKISLEYSKMQQVQDSSEISYDFSSLGLRSSQELSKIKIFLQERAQKIKRLSIYPMETIIIESQKSFISEFDTNPFSPRAKDTSYLTADQSQLYKMKQSSPLCLEKAFTFTIDQLKAKCDNGTSTQIPLLRMVKSDSVYVKPTLANRNFKTFESVSQMIFPLRKNMKNTEAQHQTCIFESFSTQTSLVEVQTIGFQIRPQIEEIQTQTNKQTLEFGDNFSVKCHPHKKETSEFATQKDNIIQLNKETQFSPLLQEVIVQTLTKSLTFTPTLSEIFTPQPKIHKEGSVQTKQSQNQISSHILSETIYPSQKLKNDHNQSFIQEHVNEVIIDMSQSFEMSEHFIETLKKKLFQINENLKKLQEQKHNENNDSSSSSINGVEKIFNSISMDVEMSIHQKNLSVQTVPKFNVDLFEGNVQTSKASTNCSISTSLSFHSPSRQEAEQGKLKVPQFQQILEIESENVDSFTRFEEANIQIDSYNHTQYEGSVNRSPQQEIILNKQLKIEAYIEVQELDGCSGKKYEESTRKLQRLLGSPKNHIIQKQKVSSPLNSPKNKHSKNQLKPKTGKFEKPKQLQQISDIDFDLICRRFKAKRMKLVEKKEQKQMRNESTDASQYQMYHHLLSRQLIVVFCKQVLRKNSFNKNLEIMIVHESRVMSLTQNYEFEASRIIVSASGDRMILGNQEITLTENQLKFSLKNKVNHFYGFFPSQTTQSQIESIKQKEFEVLNMFKYKFK